MSTPAGADHGVRAALYGRVSTGGQSTESQRHALRRYAEARGWHIQEFVDLGVSGAKERRPALDRLVKAARARQIDVVAVTKLDRLARSTHHLVSLGRELAALGVDLVVLDQQIDTTTPSGRLLFHVLAAIAEFERDLIRERVKAGLERAKAQGRKLGRPRKHHVDLATAQALIGQGMSLRAVARRLEVQPSAVRRAIAAG